MGISLKDQGEIRRSNRQLQQASRSSLIMLRHIKFKFCISEQRQVEEGLDEYEWRWKTPQLIQRSGISHRPCGMGLKALKCKTILLWGEQGPGDVVMWSSCLSLVASQAEICILECQEKLVPLFARSFPNVEVKVENRA